jgi:hypothetical protein
MYCVKCGVELTKDAKKCPLCETAVCHPDFITDGDDTSLFPKADTPPTEYNKTGILFVITALYVLAISLCLVCDISVHRGVRWSGYAVSALLLSYVIAVLPAWFKHPNPVIFVPCDFAGILAVLHYVSYRTDGGWFLTFAFPVVAVTALITTAVVTLLRYTRRARLHIIGGMFISVGVASVLLEYLIRITFFGSVRFIWSYYPVFSFFLIGMSLILVAIIKPLRRSLEKIFYL